MVNKKYIARILAVVLVFICVCAVSAQTYSDAEARGILKSVGVEVNYPEPRTSLAGIRHATLTEIIDFRQLYGRSITITGGTEGEHTDGTYSHANGYKFDLGLNSNPGISDYIRRNFRKGNTFSPYSEIYYSPSGAQYGLEGTHWDVVVR